MQQIHENVAAAFHFNSRLNLTKSCIATKRLSLLLFLSSLYYIIAIGTFTHSNVACNFLFTVFTLYLQQRGRGGRNVKHGGKVFFCFFVYLLYLLLFIVNLLR